MPQIHSTDLSLAGAIESTVRQSAQVGLIAASDFTSESAVQAAVETRSDALHSTMQPLKIAAKQALALAPDILGTAQTGGAVAQVETATLVGTITEPGDIKITVTGEHYPTPIEILVAVADNDTASQQGTKVRAALNSDARVTAHYTVGGAGANYSLTKTNAANNDSTLNLKHEAVAPTVGLTTAASSTNTTAGVNRLDDIYDAAPGNYGVGFSTGL